MNYGNEDQLKSIFKSNALIEADGDFAAKVMSRIAANENEVVRNSVKAQKISWKLFTLYFAVIAVFTIIYSFIDKAGKPFLADKFTSINEKIGSFINGLNISSNILLNTSSMIYFVVFSIIFTVYLLGEKRIKSYFQK